MGGDGIDRAHPKNSNLHLAYLECQKIFDGEKIDSRSILSKNVIHNFDFSKGLDSWTPLGCKCYINGYAVVTDKSFSWGHLEQDITRRVSPGVTYTVSAIVAASGKFDGCSEIRAVLRLEDNDSTSFYFISGFHVVKDEWELLQGSFVLERLPKRVVFYVEGVAGPFEGLDLLIKSVLICPLTPSQTDENENVIVNHQFDDGLINWSGRGCNIKLLDSIPRVLLNSDKSFASTTNRTLPFNGIQQEITGRVQSKLSYEAIAVVRIYGNNCSSANVIAKLWIQSQDNPVERISIASVQATDNEWTKVEGKFIIKESSPSKVVIYLEGPPPGTDILLKSLVVKLAEK